MQGLDDAHQSVVRMVFTDYARIRASLVTQSLNADNFHDNQADDIYFQIHVVHVMIYPDTISNSFPL